MAACELRFPALVEIDRVPLDTFRKAIRRVLPRFDQVRSVDLTLGERSETEYRFGTKGNDVTLLLKPSALVLESRRYTSFVSLASLLDVIIPSAKGLIDSDFFTRIGLRYVNSIPFNQDDVRSINGWINPDLVRPLAQGVYGAVSTFTQEVRGYTSDGKFTLRHGIGRVERRDLGYTLDLDFYDETVEATAALKELHGFNAGSYALFRWAIGERALSYLRGEGPAIGRN